MSNGHFCVSNANEKILFNARSIKNEISTLRDFTLLFFQGRSYSTVNPTWAKLNSRIKVSSALLWVCQCHRVVCVFVLTVLKYSIPDDMKPSAISLLVMTHDIGWPFPMGLPIVTISGTKSSPCSWKPQKWEPTLPKPTWTSSAIKTPPAFLTCLWNTNNNNTHVLIAIF